MNLAAPTVDAPRTDAPSASIPGLIARLVVLGIIGPTLFFKFSGAAESVSLFEQLGAEPFGRYAIGSLELVALLLLFRPATRAFGSAFSLGLMGGAIFSHLTILGIEVDGDGGTLFGMAVVGALAAGFATFAHRRELPLIGDRL